MRIKILILSFLFTLFILPSKVWAENEFSTSYDVIYDVGADGVTEVKEKISLKNLTSKYYASNFILTIGSTTVSDLVASDEAGSMETKLEQKGNASVITLKLNQQVAGLDKLQTFNLKFKSKDFAQNIGRTWEVNLPKIPESSNISTYNLVLSVPVAFGDPTSISPIPKSESQTFERLFFTFGKEQFIKSGISISFGTTQIFDFTMKYILENNALFPLITSVTLPPDTNYQDVLISRIEPTPINVTLDEDGNYLAWYQLSRKSKQEIQITGSAKLHINPKTSQVTFLSPKEKEKLTRSNRYWETNSPAVITTLAEIFKEGTPKQNKEKAKLIYQYVVDHLKYDTLRLKDETFERLGAVTALNNPEKAVCMEFTDLLITLLRASGIPARELDGFAYSQNPNLRPLSLSKNLLHAWVEYFIPDKGWIMVDPTWENSSGGVDYFNKFDLNHIVFATKGVSSQKPYISDEIKVNVSQNDFLGKPQLLADLNLPSFWAGLPATLSVKIKNQGNMVQSPTTLTFKSGQIKILGPDTTHIGPIPPFGSADYQFSTRVPFAWQETSDEIEIDLAGQKLIRQVIIKPLFMFIPIPYLILGVGASLAIIYGTVLGLHFYQKRLAGKS